MELGVVVSKGWQHECVRELVGNELVDEGESLEQEGVRLLHLFFAFLHGNVMCCIVSSHQDYVLLSKLIVEASKHLLDQHCGRVTPIATHRRFIFSRKT